MHQNRGTLGSGYTRNRGAQGIGVHKEQGASFTFSLPVLRMVVLFYLGDCIFQLSKKKGWTAWSLATVSLGAAAQGIKWAGMFLMICFTGTGLN